MRTFIDANIFGLFGINTAEYGYIALNNAVQRIATVKCEIQIYLALDRSLDRITHFLFRAKSPL